MKNIIYRIPKYICFLLLVISVGFSYGQNSHKKKLKKQLIGGGKDWNYSQAVKITDFSELLFISGQIPEDDKGYVPSNIKEQCELAWANVEKQLEAAEMSTENLIKVKFFVSDRKYLGEVAKLRNRKLMKFKPALTIIITGIYRKEWLLEIEAVAAK